MAEEQKTNIAKLPPNRKDFVPLNKVANLAELFKHPDFAERIAKAAPKHFNAERLLRTMVTATNKTPKLNDVHPMSMLGACITIAALGLEPNTPLQHAHLIPFEVNKWNPDTRKREYVRTDVQVIIGYQGYLDLIYRGDKVKDVHCDVFYEDDIKSGRFSYAHGSKKHLTHNPSILAAQARDPAEKIAGAYMYATLQNGGEVFEVFNLAQIHRARARSQGYQAAMYAYEQAVKANKDPMKDKRYSEAPWIKDENEMARKTLIRAGQKALPKTVELAAAITIDGEAEDVTIDFSTIGNADNVLDGTFETVDNETAQISVDNSPKITVPVDTKEKVTAEAKAAYATAGKAPSKAAKAPSKSQDDPPSDRFGPSEDDYSNQSVAKHDDTEHTKAQPSLNVADPFYPLHNCFGENDDGPFGPATDPVEFAKEFARVYAEATPDQRITLAEFNDDSTVAAIKASQEAASIIAKAYQNNPQKAEVKPDASPALQEAAKAQLNKMTEDALDIPRQKTPKGGWDVVAWVNLAKRKMAEISDAATLQAFVTVNAASIQALPATAGTIFRHAHDDRAFALKGEPEEEQLPEPEEAEVPMPGEDLVAHSKAANAEIFPPKDEWERLYTQFQIDIRMAKSAEDLRVISSSAAMKVQLRRLKENRPDLAQALNEQYAAKDAELKGKELKP